MDLFHLLYLERTSLALKRRKANIYRDQVEAEEEAGRKKVFLGHTDGWREAADKMD